MIATIMSGSYDTADVAFLLAVVLAVLAAVMSVFPFNDRQASDGHPARPFVAARWSFMLLALAVAATAFGLLAL